MQQFDITIKNDKIKYYKFIALLLVLLNMVVFIFLLIADVHFYEAAAILLLSGLYLIYLYYIAKKTWSIFFINRSTFFILAGSWVALQNYLVAFGCVAIGIVYHLSLQKLQFVFNCDFIKKMNFPQKTYEWKTLTNVMLKDGILTIDSKNNTLIQLEIDSDINETQFNEFANQQLFKNRDSR
ncbi:MAG: hypothetical protein ABI863_04950 [Ginsengibacter sp.]